MEDVDQVPLTAIPILLQIIGQPDHASRDETLAILCDLVGSCYDAEGEALGAVLRDLRRAKPSTSADISGSL